MNPLVSVIIPVFMVESQLSKCLRSVADQTYDNLEVVLVDDGSKDRSGIMCDEYALHHHNVIVLHQENQGLSIARNNGVLSSHGEYITFIDSDDYVSKYYIEYLVRAALCYGSDIVVSQYTRLETNFHSGEDNFSILGCYKSKDALEKMLYGEKNSPVAWGKLYKRKIVTSFPYPEKKLYEDQYVTYKMIDSANLITILDSILYVWTVRKGSITESDFNMHKLDAIDGLLEMYDFCVDRYPELQNAASSRCIIVFGELSKMFLFSPNSKIIFKKLRSLLFKQICDTIIDRNSTLLLRMKALLFLCGYYPTKITILLKGRIEK